MPESTVVLLDMILGPIDKLKYPDIEKKTPINMIN